ncbi:MAG TPA: TAT-variant-translocated molybdopterin oxidoreductase [Chthoniobacterales bacterium]
MKTSLQPRPAWVSHFTSRFPQWRSMAQMEDLPEFRSYLEREFPEGASEWSDGLSRRRFLGLMGASLALAGFCSCSRQPIEKLAPYVRQPPELIPGEPLWFASAHLLSGVARGILVESHEGRPTKVEGNPDHPGSLGGTDAMMQASILQLYDPDRSQTPLKRGIPSTWNALLTELLRPAARWGATKGAGLRFVSGRTTSPTLLDQMNQVIARYPDARWTIHEPAVNSSALRVVCNVERADVILAIDADFLGSSPAQLAYARQFARRRKPGDTMNRLYVAESAPSLTGAAADHRFVLGPDDLFRLPERIEHVLSGASDESMSWLGALARDLGNHSGRSLVLAGEFLPAAVHEAVYALNTRLGNIGSTVQYLPGLPEPAKALPFSDLVAEMQNGKVEALLILGTNPVYTSPADIDFAKALSRVPFTLHHGLYVDETATHCSWHLPETDTLESWSDAAAFDGALCLLQPLIEPLYDGISPHELLAALLGQPAAKSYDIVRGYWLQRIGGADFGETWHRALSDGVVAGQTLRPSPAVATSTPRTPPEPLSGEGLHLLIRPDPHVYDGRFANNAWLQELPKPLTKITWENAAHMAPSTASRINLKHGDVVELDFFGRKITAPLWVLPGMAEDSVLIHLGYGRTSAGKVGDGVGFNAYALRTQEAPWGGSGLQVRATGARHVFSTTQEHSAMEYSHPVRFATLTEFKKRPEFVHAIEETPAYEESLYPPVVYNGYSWGMTIDLNTCIGCSACIIACQAENNIPVVGRDQVMRGREMHWIRVDRYFSGPAEAPQILHQPVPCMHCENAPCEVVCPVAATVHDSEGLNAMVYNRCIGTRYCSNNCPYKVRRFNFFHYSETKSPTLKMQRNPQVTVRTRGVIEKCTYCVQRISAARIKSEVASRAIRDGEVVPACAQACPAEAIRFGNLNDPVSVVRQFKKDPRNYSLLGELNTRPRTTYLARIFNHNTEIS